MNNNINKKLEDVLSKLNPSDLKMLAASPGIQSIIKNLSPADKQKLISEFSNLNSDEIKRKLNSSNLNSFRNMSADEIIKHLKSK